MKPIIPFSLLGALFAIGANAAVTDPVGYITHDVAGNTGGLSAGAVTFASPTLVQPNTFAGASTESPSGGTVITFASGVPTDLGTGDVLEVTSGDLEGWWSTVMSSTDTTITINDEFPAGLPANTDVAVRPHTTVKDFLGSNVPGLTPFDGVTVNDEVLILNPMTQASTTLAYVPAAISGAAEDGWFDLGSSTAADDMVIEPGSSIQIKRFSAEPLSFTSVGAVKLTDTQVDIFPNFNWVGTHSAVGDTLNGMGYNTQLIIFDGTNANFDQLQFINPDQGAVTYAAVDPSFFGGPTVGNLGDSTDAGGDPFPEGQGAIIIRDGGEEGSIITIPGTEVAP